MKAACTNAEAKYEDVAPYIIGSISTTVELLIGTFKSASKSKSFHKKAYLETFNALMCSLYYFFTVHATVPSSYQVARATILTIRFFRQQLPEFSESIHEIVRALIQDVTVNPALQNVAMSECVPIEILNVILASTELPANYRTNVQDVRERVLGSDRIDYFSIVSLLFYFGNTEPAFVGEVEDKLTKDFLPKAQPSRSSHDAHFMLDLASCPHLTGSFRREVLRAIFKGLEISDGFFSLSALLLEFEQNPWFVNWKQIDLLNHLRKKELRAVY
jgi:hypothetical protein